MYKGFDKKKVLTFCLCRSQWPRGLRRRSAAARLLRTWVRIPPGVWIFVSCECCVLSDRGICDELITRPEKSYRLCCVVMCDLETSRMRRPWPTLGRSATAKKKIKNCLCILHATNHERKILSFSLYIRTFYIRNHRKNLAIHVPEDCNDWTSFWFWSIIYEPLFYKISIRTSSVFFEAIQRICALQPLYAYSRSTTFITNFVNCLNIYEINTKNISVLNWKCKLRDFKIPPCKIWDLRSSAIIRRVDW